MIPFVAVASFIALNGKEKWLNTEKKEFAVFTLSFLPILISAKLPIVILINDLDYILPRLEPFWGSTSWLAPSLTILFFASAWQLASVKFSINILIKNANTLLMLICSVLALFISLGLFWDTITHANIIIPTNGGSYFIFLHFFRTFLLISSKSHKPFKSLVCPITIAHFTK